MVGCDRLQLPLPFYNPLVHLIRSSAGQFMNRQTEPYWGGRVSRRRSLGRAQGLSPPSSLFSAALCHPSFVTEKSRCGFIPPDCNFNARGSIRVPDCPHLGLDCLLNVAS